jgi:xanthine dehydrogenase accessory factor
MKRALLQELLTMREARKPVALVTMLESGAQALVSAETRGPLTGIDEAALEAAHTALRLDRSGTVAIPSGEAFVQVFMPPRRMFIIGAVHIAQTLVPMAMLSGYEVAVIDPRRAFATDERFPSVEVVKEWPDRALQRLMPDRQSAIIALTHDPKLDEPALRTALQTDAFYIGALGSKKTQADRRERLRASGFDERALARIHGPIGLNVGAKTPAEIAISIMGEVTQVLRQEIRGAENASA